MEDILNSGVDVFLDLTGQGSPPDGGTDAGSTQYFYSAAVREELSAPPARPWSGQ
ncbi:hypothetical protein ACNKHL_22135 [Shigella flexneri]